MLSGFVMSGDSIVVKVVDDKIIEIDEKLAPLFFKNYSDIGGWLESRAIDSHRTNSRLLKKALRLDQKDDISTVLAVNAVTITDNFWFKEKGSELTWNDVRFKENIFDNLALKGDPDSFNQAPSRTPELTNTGSYEKCWRLIDGKWWMYKNENGLERFSELFIYNLGVELGFNMALYESDNGYIRTLDFTNNASVNFEPASSLVGDNEDYSINFNTMLSFSEDIAKDYIRMIYLDTLCMNMDRHTKNYGVLRDISTGDVISLAPNFDNNISLISRGYPKNKERNNDMLVELFVEFIRETPKAKELFDDLSIKKVTAELIKRCIENTKIDVDDKYIIDFILKGQQLLENQI